MNSEKDLSQIRTRPAEKCWLCGEPGRLIYEKMRDRCLAAPGEWNWRKCQNQGCGMVWLDPLPLEEDIGKAYQGYYTHSQPEPAPRLVRTVCWAIWNSYLGARFGYQTGVGPKWLRLLSPLALLHPGGREELDAAAMHLPAPRPASRLMDVGCGSGVALQRMQSFGWQVEGVDPDPSAAEAARARGVLVRTGSLAQQHYPDNHFDAIHMAHVLEHVHDPTALLRECFRVLKPGGTLVAITPNSESMGHDEFGASWLALDPPRHLLLFSLGTLRQTAESAGFQIQKLHSTVRIAWVSGALSGCIRRTGRGEVRRLGEPANLMRGILFQLRERLALRSDPKAGDELRLIASKPGS
jgi:2-polyprenyl-3-methyl-5-hydroxy-6-metoxy-1,4-benzoquinol methylase